MANKVFTLLHTSDWHLGQSFMGKSRLSEHKQFLEWLEQTAVENRVDAIVVAGDIFDTGSPPSYARELYNQFIVSLHATGIRLVILGGNHDSVATLSESRSLLACLRTHLVAGALETPEQQVLTLETDDGVPQAIICAIPFLRPRDITKSLSGQSGLEKQGLLQDAIFEHYKSVHAVAVDKQTEIARECGERVPIIATGHLSAVGAKTSDSVRDVYIGSLDAFPTSGFPPADYIALGHIHRHQRMSTDNRIQYSGSPIPLSFDELNHDKVVLISSFSDGKLDEVKPVVIPRFQSMAVIQGDLQTIESEILALLEKQTVTQVGDNTVWLDIEVHTQDYLNDLQDRIQTIITGLPVEVLLLRRARTQSNPNLTQDVAETLDELTPNDVFSRRLLSESWDTDVLSAQKERVEVLFDELVTRLQTEGSE